ncbi:MAG: T9SS type A sorting domain-containing protein, partial [Bacteroidota bacterium]
ANLKIRYFRRSHGSQIDVGGMAALRRYSGDYNNLYAYNSTGAGGEMYFSTLWNSLDFENDTWLSTTRDYLDASENAGINVVMWAWSSYFYAMDVDQYLADMESLISEYGTGGSEITAGNRSEPVTFIFQTSCGQKSIERNDAVYTKNKKIREHCINNNRIIFDFNDIECYDPDGNYYGDGAADGSYTNVRMLHDDISYISDSTNVSIHSGRGNWGLEWMNRNPNAELTKIAADNICTVCEHSDQRENPAEDNSRLHCVLKGRAAWWMWAVLAGWEDGITTNIEQKQYNKKVGDLNNYPNPFDTSTTIVYSLKENAHVTLEIWNSRGQKIRTLVNKKQAKGNYSLPISLDNKKGVYFYTLKVNGKQISNKMLKLK